MNQDTNFNFKMGIKEESLFEMLEDLNRTLKSIESWQSELVPFIGWNQSIQLRMGFQWHVAVGFLDSLPLVACWSHPAIWVNV